MHLQAVNDCVRQKGILLRDLFDRYDSERSGALQGGHLKRMLLDLMPTLNIGQLRYLQVMLDVNGDGKVTYKEIIQVLCWKGIT